MNTNPKITGNRCGHDVSNIKKTLRFDAATRPAVIKSLMTQIARFSHDPSVIKSLSTSGKRQQRRRSESREAINLVLQTIAKYTQITDKVIVKGGAFASGFNVGFKKNGQFQFLTYKNICNQTGLTISRVDRAMKVIKASGMVRVIEQSRLNEKGEFVAEIAIKFVTVGFFGMFGLANRLREFQEKIKKIQEKRTAEKAKKAAEKAHYEKQMARHKELKAAPLTGNVGAIFNRINNIRNSQRE